MKIVGKDEGKLIVKTPDRGLVLMTEAEYEEAVAPKAKPEPEAKAEPEPKSVKAAAETKDVKGPKESK